MIPDSSNLRLATMSGDEVRKGIGCRLPGQARDAEVFREHDRWWVRVSMPEGEDQDERTFAVVEALDLAGMHYLDLEEL